MKKPLALIVFITLSTLALAQEPAKPAPSPADTAAANQLQQAFQQITQERDEAKMTSQAQAKALVEKQQQIQALQAELTAARAAIDKAGKALEIVTAPNGQQSFVLKDKPATAPPAPLPAEKKGGDRP